MEDGNAARLRQRLCSILIDLSDRLKCPPSVLEQPLLTEIGMVKRKVHRLWLRAVGIFLTMWKPIELCLQWAEHTEFVSSNVIHGGWIDAIQIFLGTVPAWVGWAMPLIGLTMIASDLFFLRVVQRQKKPINRVQSKAPSLRSPTRRRSNRKRGQLPPTTGHHPTRKI